MGLPRGWLLMVAVVMVAQSQCTGSSGMSGGDRDRADWDRGGVYDISWRSAQSSTSSVKWARDEEADLRRGLSVSRKRSRIACCEGRVCRRPNSGKETEYPGTAAIISPEEGKVWTSSYLTIQWGVCGIEGRVMIFLDERHVVDVEPSPIGDGGQFVLWGISDGPHEVRLLFPEASVSVESKFEVRKGEALLEGMARRNPDAPPRGGCAEQDVTLVTAALDIGRRHGDVSFVDDYIGNLLHILSLGCRVVIYIEAKYAHHLKGHLHELSLVRTKDIDDLKAFKHHEAVERLRNSSAWLGSRMNYNPAKMPLYNSLVMSKLLWLNGIAAENPLESEHFLWVDAGLCVKFIAPPLSLNVLRPALHRGRFVIFSMHDGAGGLTDVHGFSYKAYSEVLGVAHPGHLARGNIFGGSARAIAAAVADYDEVLDKTLSRGYMGTEESALTAACARNESLCSVMSVSDNSFNTEMPCNMFNLVSSKSPSVQVVQPAGGSYHATEGTVACARARFPPHTSPGGEVCIAWRDGESSSGVGGRKCSSVPESSTVSIDDDFVTLCNFVGGMPPGLVIVRAELVTADGLPFAASDPVEIIVEPSAGGGRGDRCALVDGAVHNQGGEGDKQDEYQDEDKDENDEIYFDDLAHFASFVARRPSKGVAVVIGKGCPGFVDGVTEAGYKGRFISLQWGEALPDKFDYGAVDIAYLCAPPGTGTEEQHSILRGMVAVLRAGGVVAGSEYYNVEGVGGAGGKGDLLHGVKKAVDAFACAVVRGRVHATQELHGRTWFVNLDARTLPVQ